MTSAKPEELPKCVTDGLCTGEFNAGKLAIGFCAAISWAEGTDEQQQQR